MPPSALKPMWSSSLSFYLATVGASVGLGSIWRFPYLVGSSGGSAFVFVFVLACLLIATPLLAAEFLIGRHSGLNPPQAAGAVALESSLSSRWNIIGVMGTVAAFMIASYYTVLAGWVMAYTWNCARGALVGLHHPQVVSLWHEFLADPASMAAWHAAFITLVAIISARGVNRGLEVANRIRAPVLLVLMLILVAYALSAGDWRRGLAFAFSPNFAAITPPVVLAAIGQAFYATGVGAAMMLAYGAYLKRGTSLLRSSLIISAAILLVSLLATLIVFPLVFRFGMNPAQGPDLVFDVLASVFAEMPGGRLVGTLFFLLLVFAALTPSLACLEPVIAWLQQSRGMRRIPAVILTMVTTWLAGIASVLSFNRWSAWFPFDRVPGLQGKTVFVALDFVASNILLPTGALLTSVFVGWRVRRSIVADELSETTPFGRKLIGWLLSYLCPLAIAAVSAANLF